MPRRPSILIFPALLGACVTSIASQVPRGPELDAQCSGGSAVACRDLGFLLSLLPDGGAEAAQYFRIGCEKDQVSCDALASYIQSPIIRPKEKAWALRTLLDACDRGHSYSCAVAAEAYLSERIAGLDLAAAARLNSRACELGEARSCYGLSLATMEGHLGVMRDADAGVRLLARSLELYERGCAGGRLGNCDFLEELYLIGSPVRFDLAAAQRARTSACDAGRQGCLDPDAPSGWAEADCRGLRAIACWWAAAHLRSGQRVPEALALADKFDEWACTNGEARACTELAQELFVDGGSRDEARLLRVLKRGCEQGDARDCYSLLLATDEGRLGAAADLDAGAALFDRTVALYEASCAANDDPSCVFLDELYAWNRAPINVDRVRSVRRGWCKAGRCARWWQSGHPRMPAHARRVRDGSLGLHQWWLRTVQLRPRLPAG